MGSVHLGQQSHYQLKEEELLAMHLALRPLSGIQCGLIKEIATGLNPEMQVAYLERVKLYSSKSCPCYLAQDKDFPCKYVKGGEKDVKQF